MSNFLDFATPLDSPFAGDAGSSCSVTSGHCPPGTIERVTCWPMKEVPNNLDMTTGMLGLRKTRSSPFWKHSPTVLRRLTHTLSGAVTSASLSRPSRKT
jgi:hypothetical protein